MTPPRRIAGSSATVDGSILADAQPHAEAGMPDTVALRFFGWKPGAVSMSEYVPAVDGPGGHVQTVCRPSTVHDIVTAVGPESVASTPFSATPSTEIETVRTISLNGRCGWRHGGRQPSTGR